ncbi:SHOCT domain-containing protein [Leucobacter sp. G161]|uniref:SHOCT domain-containing protein n=1 Tax=Leucobacter sp. G161 TaxID=663704 RepID=UPI00073BB4A7|nr:SHOCT domain-containing protein [Leucobacter sp. G161]KUF07567.1 hypothetical protein AUL38_08340 [Leucobacter sp. G161]
MSFWDSLWNIITVFFWAFVFIAALYALIAIITDLFRDKHLNGWWKALWLVFLVFVPLLTSLVYIIARGEGMSERGAKSVAEGQQAAEEYIRSVAGSSPADEIAKAQALLDSGAISVEEFTALKQHALGSVQPV